jgi:pimeloyl-ACP methyl ester carboxylesterase
MTAHPTPDDKDANDAGVSRRVFITAAAAGLAVSPSLAHAAIVRTDLASLAPYGNGTLPAGIRSRAVAGVNGLTVHMLEAGFEESGRPAVVLLHGFPELAYSWRKVMLPLAVAGYHVIAPDQRGYGRTTGWDDSYDADGDPFRTLNMVRDVVSLVYALGYKQVDAIVGHDAGAPVAAWSALIRLDIFRSLALMSSPFAGAPSLPFNTANGAAPPRPPLSDDELDAEMAKLDRPRKYYQNYQRTRGANDNMLHAPQGLHAFLRAYYHYKSADWKGNQPFPRKARTAEEMSKIPTYYVMDKPRGPDSRPSRRYCISAHVSAISANEGLF